MVDTAGIKYPSSCLNLVGYFPIWDIFRRKKNMMTTIMAMFYNLKDHLIMYNTLDYPPLKLPSIFYLECLGTSNCLKPLSVRLCLDVLIASVVKLNQQLNDFFIAGCRQ